MKKKRLLAMILAATMTSATLVTPVLASPANVQIAAEEEEEGQTKLPSKIIGLEEDERFIFDEGDDVDISDLFEVAGTEGKITISYLDENEDKMDEIPSKPGFYYIVVEVEEDEDYQGIYWVYDMIIRAAKPVTGDEPVTSDEPVTGDEPSVVKKPTYIEAEDLEFTYTGEGIAYPEKYYQVIGGNTSPLYISYCDSKWYPLETELPINVGQYYVYFGIGEDDEYEGCTVRATISIKQAECGLEMADKTVTYNGKEAALEPTSDFGKIAVAYYKDEAMKIPTSTEDGAAKTKGAPVNAGTYYVRAKVAGTNNYTGDTVTSKLVIEKKDTKLTMDDKTAVYDGNAVTMTAKANYKGAKIAYGYYTDEAMTNKLKSAPVNAGTYYVRAKVAGDANHKAKTTKAVLKISKASTTISATTSKSINAADVKSASKSFSMNVKASSGATAVCTKTEGSSKLSVTSAGTVKVKAGTAKGTYTMKVSVKAPATKNYKAKTVTKTVTVTVK